MTLNFLNLCWAGADKHNSPKNIHITPPGSTDVNKGGMLREASAAGLIAHF